MDDEDASPTSKRVGERTGATSYIWANCKRKGWQVLVPVENLKLTRPEPPASVLFSQPKPPKSDPGPIAPEIAPTEEALIHQTSRLKLPVTRAVEVNTANTNQAWKESLNKSPRSLPQPSSRDFIGSNKLNISPPKRVTKTALLEQAAQQLRESEKIGETLAAKLKIIKKKIET